MSDGWFYLGLFVIGTGIVIYNIIQAERTRKKRFLQQLEEQWGNFSEREYGYEEYECISHYFWSKEENETHVIDDITWNDLDMDRLFRAMNHTQSSLGAEQLYYMLRTPVMEKKVLEEREKVFEYMKSHKEQRIKMQTLFSAIGRTREYAITDYIFLLKEVKLERVWEHYVAAFLGIVSIGSMLLDPVIGIFLVIGIFILNSFTYCRDKAKMEPCLISFAYLLRMMKAADLLQKEKLDVLESYQKELKELNKKFIGFRKKSGIVMSVKSTGNMLDAIFDYVRMFSHIDLIQFNKMLKVYQKELDSCQRMIEIVGFLDAAIAVASFREALPYYSVPFLKEEKKGGIKVGKLYHPLIEEPVSNDIFASKGVLITGSNASGKSTFLKTVAINAILSQTIHTSVSNNYEAPFYRIYSSMSLRDNLEENESYYMVEIKSLRRILEAVRNSDVPMLSFVDEVLRGTNTVERIAASSQILKELNQDHVLSFAATHDIELTYLLEKEYDNFHFKEEIKEGDILFSYKLFNGRAESRNAIKLLELMGYEKEIVDNAEKCANLFLKTGQWKM